MKILFFTVALLTMSTQCLTAQSIGLKGGLNYLNVSSQEDVKFSTSQGFHMGLMVESSTLPLINISSGIFYTRRGYKTLVNNVSQKSSIDYIDIPIDAILKIDLLNIIGAFVSVGPYFSYGVSSNINGDFGSDLNGYDTDDIDLKRLDSGINIGAGVELGNLRLSSAYGISMTDNGAVENNELRHRVFKISLGYFFLR